MSTFRFPDSPKPQPIKLRRYQRRVVVFLDMLGFKEFIKRAGRDPKKVEFIHELLVHNDWKRKLGWTGELTAFSDSIIVSEEVSSCYLRSFLTYIGRIQHGFIYREVPLRGAVTVGNLFHADGIVFGPALIRAHQLESTTARFPRVIIDHKLVEAVMANKDASVLIKQDTDEQYFINFVS